MTRGVITNPFILLVIMIIISLIVLSGGAIGGFLLKNALAMIPWYIWILLVFVVLYLIKGK